ncbi:MAG: hypothetical protein AAF654_10245 [Myxococcota bacterium]
MRSRNQTLGGLSFPGGAVSINTAALDARGDRGRLILNHEAAGHGIEQRDPQWVTLLAMAAYLDRVDAGTTRPARSYGSVNVFEFGSTGIEAYWANSTEFARQHPNLHRLFTTALSADRRTAPGPNKTARKGGTWHRSQRRSGLDLEARFGA